jgi:hypothetical protein
VSLVLPGEGFKLFLEHGYFFSDYLSFYLSSNLLYNFNVNVDLKRMISSVGRACDC